MDRGYIPLVGSVKRVQGERRALYSTFFGHRLPASHAADSPQMSRRHAVLVAAIIAALYSIHSELIPIAK